MALYYLDFKVISRSKSATTITAKAAYRSGEKIHDTTNGETYDYTRKKGVYGCEILTPDTAPGWASNRSELWNAVERKEDQSTRRNTAQLAREMLLALPTELDHDQKQTLVREYVQTHFVKRGMIADIAYHDFDSHNPHAHVLLTMREITADGFGTKNRTWNNKKLISEWREEWANHVNRDLEQAGYSERVDHRSLKEQGIDRVPQIHLGPVVCEMERNGVRTDVGDTYRAIANENRRRAQRNTVVQQQHASAELILSTQADGDTQQASDERSLIEQWQQYKELEPERDKPQETSVWEEIKSWGVTDRTIDVLKTYTGHQATQERDRRLDIAMRSTVPPDTSATVEQLYCTGLKQRLSDKGRGYYRVADRWLLTERLARRGVSKNQARRILAESSPEIMEQHPNQRVMFIRRLVDKVYNRETQRQQSEAILNRQSQAAAQLETSTTAQAPPVKPGQGAAFGKYSTFEVRHTLGQEYTPPYRPFYDPANENLVLDNPNHTETNIAELDADLVAAIKQAARQSPNSRLRINQAHRIRQKTDAETEQQAGSHAMAKREYAKELSRQAEAYGETAVLKPETDVDITAKLRIAGFSFNAINRAVIERSPIAASLPSTEHQSKYLELLVMPTLRSSYVRQAKEKKRQELQQRGQEHEYRLDRLGLATDVSKNREPRKQQRRGPRR